MAPAIAGARERRAISRGGNAHWLAEPAHGQRTCRRLRVARVDVDVLAVTSADISPEALEAVKAHWETSKSWLRA